MFAPQPDVSRFYTLSPAAETGASNVSESRGLVYGLGPVDLPVYLDRNELALRVSPAEVTYSRTDLWAEPLQTNLTRVLLQDLSALLGGDRLVLYPWPRTVSVSYQVAVTVVQFERTAAGQAQLHARWSIRDPRNAAYLVTKESTYVHPAASPAAADAVNALSADLGDLSREIVSVLQSLPAPAPAAPSGRRNQ